MKDMGKDPMEPKGLRKWFQRDNLIIVILSGVLLLVIALPTEKEKVATSGNANVSGSSLQGGGQDAAVQNAVQYGAGDVLAGSITEYETAMEKRLAEILEGMSGAGEVEVMITFASTGELVVEKDHSTSESGTDETDSQGGSREVHQTESVQTTVYSGGSNAGEPYVVKTLMPRVEGVLVAAQGAGTGEVSRNITEAVQALFDIEAHKIKVIRMKGTQ